MQYSCGALGHLLTCSPDDLGGLAAVRDAVEVLDEKLEVSQRRESVVRVVVRNVALRELEVARVGTRRPV